ncbi:MAG TPA: hypothetical protein ENN66_00720 [Proteobacteria bacterium]|nr:hypothetical protein [Pseudomonadota bacterium]
MRDRALRGGPDEQQLALTALGKMRSSAALKVLLETLAESRRPEKTKAVLRALSGPPWPGESADAAKQLARRAENIELYPELLKALAALECNQDWTDLLASCKSPLQQPHYREIALFMCRQAQRPQIRKQLLSLLEDPDWNFSYRLLNLLSPHFRSDDIPTLLNLLKDREERRALTIQERLTRGQDLEKINSALTEFLNQHPEIAHLVLTRLLFDIAAGNMPTNLELLTQVHGRPPELQALLLGQQPDSEPDFPLLLAAGQLSEIMVDGSDCFALVVHRTRRYSGFFREAVNSILHQLLEQERELAEFQSLPILNRIIDFIRGQPHYPDLREKVLARIIRITRNCRELKVFSEASQTRDLKIIKIRKP